MPRTAWLLALSLLAGGCTWISGGDSGVKPAELADIQPSVAVTKVWESRVGKGTGGAFVELVPATAGERVYAASHDGVVTALNAASGNTLWEVNTKLPITAGVGLGEGLVLVGSAKGQVLALRQDDGGEVWRARVSSEVLAPPRAADGVVVVRTGDGRLTGLDAATGTQRWVYSYTVPLLTLRGSAPPLLGQGMAIIGLDTGRLLVLSLRDGVPVWEKVISPPRGRTELERLVDIDAEPRIAGGVLYVAAYQGNLTAIDLRNGSTLWSRNLSAYAGLDADRQGVYVSAADDVVWALDRLSGQVLWKQEGLAGRRLSAPVATGNYVVVGDFEGYLHWLGKDDGRLVGRAQSTDEGVAAAPVAEGNLLYVLGKDGRLSAFEIGGS